MFQDILKRNTYIFKGRILLDDTEIIDVVDGKDLQIGLTSRHCFRIFSQRDKKSTIFCVRSAKSKQKWLDALKQEREIIADDQQNFEITPQVKKLAALASSKEAIGIFLFSILIYTLPFLTFVLKIKTEIKNKSRNPYT